MALVWELLPRGNGRWPIQVGGRFSVWSAVGVLALSLQQGHPGRRAEQRHGQRRKHPFMAILGMEMMDIPGCIYYDYTMIYIYIYIHMARYIYIYSYVCVYIYILIYIDIYWYIYILIYIYIAIAIYLWIHIWIDGIVNICYSNPKIDIRFGHDHGFSGSIGGPVVALTVNGVAADVGRTPTTSIWLVVWNMIFMTFHILGIIIPTDFHIFQRGRYTTNQQWSCIVYWHCPICIAILRGIELHIWPFCRLELLGTLELGWLGWWETTVSQWKKSSYAV